MSNDTIAPARLDDCLAVVAAGLGLAREEIVRIEPQTGGLFNYLLRVETPSSTYFFKQYLDDVDNPIYTPPAIPAVDRAALAAQVQQLAAEATASVVPEIVHVDRERAAFLMTEAAGDKPLNDYLSHGELPASVLTELPGVLARLHQSTYLRFAPASIFGNTGFRDFKLGLQYDDITPHLSAAETERVLDCRRAYQDRTVCVTHGDINSRNIIASDATVGVIDFEQSHLGAPAYDLSYILCEVLISLETFGRGAEVGAVIETFLDHYFEHFDAESRESVENEMTQHLAIQTLYRFWGPSRAAWTFYVDDASRARILDRSRTLLMTDGPVTAALGVRA